MYIYKYIYILYIYYIYIYRYIYIDTYIPLKKGSHFIKFNIVSFYPSISKKQYTSLRIITI